MLLLYDSLPFDRALIFFDLEVSYESCRLQKQGLIVLEDRPLPVLKEDTDAIAVTLSSICTSDLHIKHGSVPRAIPIQLWVMKWLEEVVETGSEVKNFKSRDRVSINVETFCGKCFYCQRGFVNNCTDPQGGWALGCRIDGGAGRICPSSFLQTRA